MDLLDLDWYIDNVLVPDGPASEQTSSSSTTPRPAEDWQQWWREEAAGLTGAAGELAATQGFVLSARQLRDLGRPRHRLRTDVARGRWSVPARGSASPIVVTGSRPVDSRRRHALRAAATCLLRPGTLVSGSSAAILHGLPTMDVPERCEVTSYGLDSLGQRGPTWVRRAEIPANAATRWFGAPVTTVARTLIDLSRHDRWSAIMAFDAALREQMVTDDELAAALATAVGWFGVRQARIIASLADARAESPLESITRLAMRDSRFPTPQLQVEIDGYRADFLLAGRLVVEADGREKYTDAELWREKRREHAFRKLGFPVERVIWTDVTQDWPTTARRWWSALGY